MWTTLDSPIGELRLVARTAEDGGDGLAAVEFSPFPERPAVSDADAWPGQRADDHPVLVETARQLTAYFAGDLEEFDLPLAPVGTEFQRRVWAELSGIGYGETVSYGQVARRLGLVPGASRAVGLANGRNPLPVVVPCHRVIGADGSLTGYAGGLDRKRLLLDLEQGALF